MKVLSLEQQWAQTVASVRMAQAAGTIPPLRLLSDRYRLYRPEKPNILASRRKV
jgi:hypothetical protein